MKYTDPDGRGERPSWKLIPEKCESYSYSTYVLNPSSGVMDCITTSRSVEHSRISYSGIFESVEISFSGTKDIIQNNVSGGVAGSSDKITLIRLNVTYNGENYDYYSLMIENTTRFLFIPVTQKSSATQLIPDLLNDKDSLYNGNFNRDIVEKGASLNALLNLATAGFLGLVSTPDPLSQNLLNAATEKLRETLSKKYENTGSDSIKRDIEYILP